MFSKSGLILRRLCVFGLTLLLVLGQLGFCAIIRVPQDHPTIKQAINSAQNSDEIIVSPGIYKESVQNNSDLNIVLRSTFSGDWSVVRNTVIDGTLLLQGAESPNMVIRGFTITRLGPYAPGAARGITGRGTRATIEFNIISNHRMNTVSVDYTPDNAPGAGIEGCDGAIRNNIIENNVSSFGGAIANCKGTIQNNLIRGNTSNPDEVPGNQVRPPYIIDGAGAALYNCTGTIRNNTIVNNYWRRADNSVDPGGLSKCTGAIRNNIIYHTTLTQTLEYNECSTPTFCLFRSPRAGQGNIAGDPKFVNPAAGDFRLQSSSPAIDAGKGDPAVILDLEGIQRGLNGVSGFRGDGSDMDIGVYEYIPKPVAVWLPFGGPALIEAGKPLKVAWKQDVASAGTSIVLRLIHQGRVVANLGAFSDSTGTHQETVTLPPSLTTYSNYAIQGISVAHPELTASTPLFSIKGIENSITSEFWQGYR